MPYQDFNPNTRLEFNADKFEISTNILSALYRTITVTLADGTKLRGVDLSHWNKNENINFVVLKANNIDFVILKVTEATTFVDPSFETKYKKALEAGLIVLPYHFFRGNYGGAPQATFTINTLDSLGFLSAINYVPIIWQDVETDDGVTVSTRQNRLLATLQTIVSNGFQGGVYSSPYYWNALVGNVSWIKDFWQWVAHWSSVSYPTLPTGWTQDKTIMWQNGIYPAHSWVEPVIGVTGNVDHNYFFGNIDDLKRILRFPTTPPPSGDCTCEEELKQLSALINELSLNLNNLAGKVNLVEGEMNNNKLEIYHLQQKDIQLDKRLVNLETLLSQLKSIICQ